MVVWYLRYFFETYVRMVRMHTLNVRYRRHHSAGFQFNGASGSSSPLLSSRWCTLV